MVDNLDAVFQALSSEVRRDMIGRLSGSELTVSQLAEPLDMSLAGASKHLQILEDAGLVQRRVEGRRHVCSLQPTPLERAFQWLRSYQGLWTAKPEAPEVPARGSTLWAEETD